MPYIAIRTSATLTEVQIEDMKTTLGEKISLIPGKVEAGLMVDITDKHHMYKAGQAREIAFVEVRCFGPTAFEAKKVFASAVFEALTAIIGLKPENVYYNHVDMDTWGSGGTFRAY